MNHHFSTELKETFIEISSYKKLKTTRIQDSLYIMNVKQRDMSKEVWNYKYPTFLTQRHIFASSHFKRGLHIDKIQAWMVQSCM